MESPSESLNMNSCILQNSYLALYEYTAQAETIYSQALFKDKHSKQEEEDKAGSL